METPVPEPTGIATWREMLRHAADVEVYDVVPHWMADQVAQMLLALSEADEPNGFALDLAHSITRQFQQQFDPTLITALNALSQNFGPMGVALAAASLTNHEALVQRLVSDSDAVAQIVEGAEQKVRMHGLLAEALQLPGENSVSYEMLIHQVAALHARDVRFQQSVMVSDEDWVKLCLSSGAMMAVDPMHLHSNILAMRGVLEALRGDIGIEEEDITDAANWGELRDMISGEIKAGNDARALLALIAQTVKIDTTPAAVREFCRTYGRLGSGITSLVSVLQSFKESLMESKDDSDNPF